MKNPYQIINLLDLSLTSEQRELLAKCFDDYAEQFITPANSEDVIEFVLNTPHGDYSLTAEHFKMTERQIVEICNKWIKEIDKGLPLERKDILMRSFPGGVN